MIIKKFEKGQSLFEMVLALGIMSLVIVTLVALAALSIKSSTFSKNKTLSSRYSQETIEWLRSERDKSWENFIEHSVNPKICLPSLSWTTLKIGSCQSTDFIPGTKLYREVKFLSAEANTVEVTVIVYWSDAGGIHEVNLATNFSDWRVQSGGSSPSPTAIP